MRLLANPLGRLRGALRRTRPAAVFVRSSVAGLRHAGEFDAVGTFAMFVGFQRSGHTLLAALLDAHPQIAIGHEQRTFRMALAGTTKNALFAELVRSSRVFLEHGAGDRSGHTYEVRGQWQGRTRDLRAIGIQRGGRASRMILKRPEIVAALRRIVGVPLCVIHALRNPFDNIASIHAFNGGALADAVTHYFESCDGVAATDRLLAPAEIVTLRHEDFVADPRAGLAALCQRLGVTAEPAYLDACAAIVRPKPNLSRQRAPWTPALLDETRRRAAGYPFLSGYTFE